MVPRALVVVVATFAIGAGSVGCLEDRADGTRIAGAARVGQPRPLAGVPLRGRTGLHLVVADRRPFVLAVDSGSVAEVKGVREVKRGLLSVVSVGGRGAAIVAPSGAEARIYGLSSHGATVTDLGRGRTVAPNATGDGLWILRRAGDAGCTIRGVTLTGRTTLRPRAFPCAATIASGGRNGVVVNRTVLYDPETARVLLRTPAGVIAAVGTTLVLAGPGRGFTLFDSVTRRRHRLRWPSILAARDWPAANPRGRFVALGFADPTWAGTGKQVLDVWLLDTRTRKLTHVPGMPAFVALKETSMSWTDDGRLVVLGRSGRRDVVAVWRPGERRLAIKSVRLRPRIGSDSFAPIR